MLYNELVDYCLSRKGAVQEFPFGPDPAVIKVGGKMFALITVPKAAGNPGDHEDPEVPGDDGNPVRISLKCDPIIAANLREEHECVQPGYHLNKEHWNTVIADGSLQMDDLRMMIDHSYDLVFGKLTKAVRESITGRIDGKS